MDKIVILKEKIHEIQSLATPQIQKHFLFGIQHHFQLNARLSEADVKRFEAQHRVELPEDYRRFVIELGDGGMCPVYWMYPLSQYFDTYTSSSHSDDDLTDFLCSPFPHSQVWGSHIDSNASLEDEEYYNHKQIKGSKLFAYAGCTVYYRLVITGSERGNIWIDDRPSDNGVFPLNSTTYEEVIDFYSPERIDFFGWYNSWLDSTIVEMKELHDQNTANNSPKQN